MIGIWFVQFKMWGLKMLIQDKKMDILIHVIEDCERLIQEKRDELKRNEDDLNRLTARKNALYEAKRIFNVE